MENKSSTPQTQEQTAPELPPPSDKKEWHKPTVVELKIDETASGAAAGNEATEIGNRS
jgi:hypothetical protein